MVVSRSRVPFVVQNRRNPFLPPVFITMEAHPILTTQIIRKFVVFAAIRNSSNIQQTAAGRMMLYIIGQAVQIAEAEFPIMSIPSPAVVLLPVIPAVSHRIAVTNSPRKALSMVTTIGMSASVAV